MTNTVPLPLDSSFHWHDEHPESVIPGEQRETRNPGGGNGAGEW